MRDKIEYLITHNDNIIHQSVGGNVGDLVTVDLEGRLHEIIMANKDTLHGNVKIHAQNAHTVEH